MLYIYTYKHTQIHKKNSAKAINALHDCTSCIEDAKLL